MFVCGASNSGAFVLVVEVVVVVVVEVGVTFRPRGKPGECWAHLELGDLIVGSGALAMDSNEPNLSRVDLRPRSALFPTPLSSLVAVTTSGDFVVVMGGSFMLKVTGDSSSIWGGGGGGSDIGGGGGRLLLNGYCWRGLFWFSES